VWKNISWKNANMYRNTLKVRFWIQIFNDFLSPSTDFVASNDTENCRLKNPFKLQKTGSRKISVEKCEM